MKPEIKLKKDHSAWVPGIWISNEDLDQLNWRTGPRDLVAHIHRAQLDASIEAEIANRKLKAQQ